jgi:hypothetical protein
VEHELVGMLVGCSGSGNRPSGHAIRSASGLDCDRTQRRQAQHVGQRWSQRYQQARERQCRQRYANGDIYDPGVGRGAGETCCHNRNLCGWRIEHGACSW